MKDDPQGRGVCRLLPAGLSGEAMKRMIGFILFWIAIGMLIMLLIHNMLVGMIIIGILLLLGYNLFC